VRDFSGRVVVVTGAASGIGRATALAFAARGADVAVCDIDRAGLAAVEAELRGAGRRVLAQAVDVSRAEEVGAFCEAVYGAFGRADVLVNNAGIALGGLCEDMTLADWRRIVAVNVWGVIHGCHFFYPPMARRGEGHIVNLASMAALGPLPATTAYCATKSAVLGLSESLRIEAARRGVGVTTVCPGAVATGIGRTLRMVTGARGLDAAEVARRIGSWIERRGLRPESAAAAIVRAVETNARLVPLGAEAHAIDLLRRAHRPSYDALMALVLRLIVGRG
jgi:NAD(P)-dependent dehydrogenase (short-subunit alcohol dehydrogenase family)